MALDFQKINEAAENYRADMAAFLRAMISHPSESCEEKEVVACIKAEMEKLNFDKVEVDGLGNVIGWMGDGEKIIAIDSHIDTEVSVTLITGNRIHTKDMKQMKSSTDVAALTRKVEWQVLYTVLKS